MKKFIRLLPVMVLSCCLLFVAACGGGGGGNTNEDPNAMLTVWAAQSDKAMIETMVAAFKAANPGVTNPIQVKVQEDNTAQTELKKDAAAAADIICIPHDQLGALVDGNYLYAITDQGLLSAIKQNADEAVKAGSLGGAQYGFPSSYETNVLYYDTRLFNSEDVRTLEGILAKDLAAGKDNFAMDFAEAYYSISFFLTYGNTLFGSSGEDKNTVDFNNAQGKAAAEKIIELKEGGRTVFMTGAGAVSRFRSQNLGAFIYGSHYAKSIGDELGDNMGIAKLPSMIIDGEAVDMKCFSGYKIYCVNSRTKNRTVSMQLAAWLTTPENQMTRFETRAFLPVHSTLEGSEAVLADAVASACLAQKPYAVAMPSISQINYVWDPVANFTDGCFKGTITAANLQEQLDRMVDQILNPLGS